MTTTNQQRAVQRKQPKKVSPEELQAMIAQYQAGEVIASRLPFTFPSGFKLTEVVPQCKLCGSEIRKQDFRGIWNQVLPDVVVIDGHGVCRSCRCITAFLIRVRGESPVVLESISDEGVWQQYTQDQTMWARIKRQLRLLTSRF
ncbi:TPA: hypothetical protein NIJ57_003737 [Pseudomonas aeruginosa]|jgi:hypothetical protein|uniref:Uncharacterized protein n=1 Tax=Pseudomonas putida TaxID=303 RepID=A0A2Z1CFW9_PSEPU|nr:MULTISPECIES: hypothetical protein [Pseudomonas]MCP8472998.1 hypothetical protein [Pseudomonas triclosanedens]ALZ46282.1 Hypothetical protein [Pseudomonas putida]EIW4148492.1 hypothetical protein [Pseudomonas aeruginosa]EKU5856946.1 hypothetical protein [Pseudomonas aeruginosa]EKV8089886.1 hypothetical protein [Pseudomonas aeruginosa]